VRRLDLGFVRRPLKITAGMGTDDTVSRHGHGLLTWISIWANGMLWSFRSCFVDLSNWPRTSVAVAPEKSGGGSRLRLSRDSVCVYVYVLVGSISFVSRTEKEKEKEKKKECVVRQ